MVESSSSRRVMESQGIRGPSYKFLYGNTKEIVKMKQQTSRTVMDLSHDIFPRIQPHFYSWIKLYGNNFLTWIGTEPQFVVTEPGLVKQILTNSDGIARLKTVPANTKLAIPPLALHRNPDIWEQDAHLFKPEGVAQVMNGNAMAFLGFGFGPRICVGLNFAMSEAKIALAMILQLPCHTPCYSAAAWGSDLAAPIMNKL